MSKYVEVEAKDSVYKLEYNRDSVIAMEEMGFDAINPEKKPMSNTECLIVGGLKMHNPNLKMREAIDIADTVIADYGLSEILPVLMDIYQDALHMEGKKKLTIKGA